MKTQFSAFERLFAVVSLATLAAGSTGCMVSVTSMAKVSQSESSLVHLEGSVSGPMGLFSGTGLACVHMHFFGLSDDKDDCATFTTDHPGHFTLDSDVTALVHGTVGLTSALDSTTYLLINGKRVDGVVQSTEVETKSHSLNGASSTMTRISVMAAYNTDKTLPQPEGSVALPQLSLNSADPALSYDRSLNRSSASLASGDGGGSASGQATGARH